MAPRSEEWLGACKGNNMNDPISKINQLTPQPAPALVPTMKIFRPLILSLGIGLLIPSCAIVPGPRGPVLAVAPGAVGVYATLPVGYRSPYYFYGNRYYYGGGWEVGRFRHGGRTYNGRYVHNGRHIYGGKYHGGSPAAHGGGAPHGGAPGPRGGGPGLGGGGAPGPNR